MFYLIFLIFLFQDSLGQTNGLNHFIKHATSNVKYTKDIIFQNTQISKTKCGVFCSSALGCVTFTFNKVTRKCQGHKRYVLDLGQGAYDAGSFTYQRGMWICRFLCSLKSSYCF